MSRGAIRNRLAKPLPDAWRQWLVKQGVPKRKYVSILRLTLADGRVLDEVVVEEGWVIALARSCPAGAFEERIDFNPRDITEVEIVQVV